MAVYGLLGEKLSHSYSPQIHKMLNGSSYGLFETCPGDVEKFITSGQWDGLNVTIPYKKKVFGYLDEVSSEAAEAGCVNTVVKRNGKLCGDNTDIYGFRRTVVFSGISVENKKALVLGSGGASAAVCIALRSLGCMPVIISRKGHDNYENLGRHADAQIIVNTTPVGMYPDNGSAPLDLSAFPDLQGVFDVIYNPLRTALLLEAERLGIPNMNGLYMLVAQAKRSAEIFTGKDIPYSEIERIYEALALNMRNVILVGMPGVGKTTAAAEICRRTGRKFIDTDELVTEKFGMTPAQMIIEKGEEEFRKAEHEVIKQAGSLSGAVIATGGGAVTYPDNYGALHQNGTIIWLQRSIEELSIQNRPISARKSPAALYEEREPLYRAFADHTIDMNEDGWTGRLMETVNERM